MRYFIELSYDGATYHGWQVQPNAITVQQVLTDCFINCLRSEGIRITGCGRTDAGVHAEQFFAHFDIDAHIEVEKAKYNLNNMLPKDIAIKRIFPVEDNVHARFNALSRTYNYHIHFSKNPFIREYSYRVNTKLDLEKMNEACERLYSHTDFTSFSKLHTDTKTNDCKIMHAAWELSATGIVFNIKADRFLRNMVRAIVGTMLEIGSGNLAVTELDEILRSKNRSNAGRSVPGHGLFLSSIEYEEGIV